MNDKNITVDGQSVTDYINRKRDESITAEAKGVMTSAVVERAVEFETRRQGRRVARYRPETFYRNGEKHKPGSKNGRARRLDPLEIEALKGVAPVSLQMFIDVLKNSGRPLKFADICDHYIAHKVKPPTRCILKRWARQMFQDGRLKKLRRVPGTDDFEPFTPAMEMTTTQWWLKWTGIQPAPIPEEPEPATKPEQETEAVDLSSTASMPFDPEKLRLWMQTCGMKRFKLEVEF